MISEPPSLPAHRQLAAYMAGPGCGEAAASARLALMDSLAGALAALDDPGCRLRLGPTVAGAVLPGGARVPGTALELEPMQAAFNLAALFGWHPGRAQWPGAASVFPGDTLAALLAVADWASRQAAREGRAPWLLGSVMDTWIKATEIHGSLAESGLDSAVSARLAAAAGASLLLGGSQAEIESALNLAWLAGGPAGKEALPLLSAQAVWAALFSLRGVSPLSDTPAPLTLPLLGCRVLRETAFAVPPAGSTPRLPLAVQTAVEAAVRLHNEVKPRLAEITRIVLETPPRQAVGWADEGSPTKSDYCSIMSGFAKDAQPNLQAQSLRQAQGTGGREVSQAVAVALLAGRVRDSDFSALRNHDPRLEKLLARLDIRECPDQAAYPLGHALQVFFSDGTASKRLAIRYPLGHPQRRAEGLGGLIGKFAEALSRCLPPRQCDRLLGLCADQAAFEAVPAHEFMRLTVPP